VKRSSSFILESPKQNENHGRSNRNRDLEVHSGLEENLDRADAITTVEFEPGKMAALNYSRMTAALQEDISVFICKRGCLRVNMQVRKNHVEIHESLGARGELPQRYHERFPKAFFTEANEFTACCLGNTSVPISLQSPVKDILIGQALKKSLITG